MGRIGSTIQKVGDAAWKDIDIDRIKKNTNKAFYLVYAVHDLEPARYEVRARCTKKQAHLFGM